MYEVAKLGRSCWSNSELLQRNAEPCELDAVSHFVVRLLCCGDTAARSWFLGAEDAALLKSSLRLLKAYGPESLNPNRTKSFCIDDFLIVAASIYSIRFRI